MTKDFYQCRIQEWSRWYRSIVSKALDNFEFKIFNVHSLVFSVHRSESRVQSPASRARVQSPTSRAQRPTLASRVQDPACQFYRRYVANIFVMFKKWDHVKKIIRYINSRHRKIKFTCEEEKDNKISFLDCEEEKRQQNIVIRLFHQ